MIRQGRTGRHGVRETGKVDATTTTGNDNHPAMAASKKRSDLAAIKTETMIATILVGGAMRARKVAGKAGSGVTGTLARTIRTAGLEAVRAGDSVVAEADTAMETKLEAATEARRRRFLGPGGTMFLFAR